jgi:hypothetical protein
MPAKYLRCQWSLSSAPDDKCHSGLDETLQTTLVVFRLPLIVVFCFCELAV